MLVNRNLRMFDVDGMTDSYLVYTLKECRNSSNWMSLSGISIASDVPLLRSFWSAGRSRCQHDRHKTHRGMLANTEYRVPSNMSGVFVASVTNNAAPLNKQKPRG